MASNPQQKVTGTPIELEQAVQLGIRPDSWPEILHQLGRHPNELEARILARVWAEDCSARTSRRFLQTFSRADGTPTPGGIAKNGVIDLGHNETLIVRLDNNNYQMSLEPGSAAATSEALPLESIRSLGAEPLGLINCYRLGNSESTENCLQLKQALLGGSHFANRAIVPALLNDIYFHPRYDGSFLANSCALGLLRELPQLSKIEIGSPVLYVGFPTGPDGLLEEVGAQSSAAAPGARAVIQRLRYAEAFLSGQLFSALRDGARKKLLLDCLDIGRGGLALAAFELSRRLNIALRVDGGRVPVRVGLNQPRQVFLSESTSRVLVITSKGKHREFGDACVAWGLEPTVIGEVVEGEGVEFAWQHHLMGNIPTKLPLGDATDRKFELVRYPPMLRKRTTTEAEAPKRMRLARDKKVSEWDMIRDATAAGKSSAEEKFPEVPESLEDLWVDLLADPNLCSRREINRFFDSAVGLRTALGEGADAAVIRLASVGVGSEKRERGLASVSSSFPLYMDEDPYLGTVQAVAAAMRALASVGAKPIGLADGLNFGNPDKHREISAFSEAVRGLGDACRVWGIPIVSDSVSLYNGSESNPILPTPSLVMFGLIEDLSKSVGAGFKRSADKIFLLGTTRDEIGCSEYLFYCHERMIGAVPDIDFETELSVCSLVRSLVERQLIVSSHTLGLGGLGIALAESCLLREKALGASLIVRLPEPHLGPVRTDSLLFSESAGRFLVSFREENEQQLRELCQAAKVPITAEGTVGGKSIRLEGALKCELPLSTAKRIWEGGLNHILLDGQSLSL